MKKLLLVLLLMVSYMGYAQELPYGKYLKYSDREFREAKFKYNDDTNAWVLRRIAGLRATANALSVLTGAIDDFRPSSKDYMIEVQKGENDLIASVNVVFYNDETYHKLLTFAKDNGQNILETSSGKLQKVQFNYGGYNILLQSKHVAITSTSGHTNVALVKSKDESYNVYNFVIETGVKPWSAYLERKKSREEKRDAKGKKKRSVDALM